MAVSDSQVPRYALTVEGIGDFVFAKRNMRRQLAIEVEIARLSEGVELTGPLAMFVGAVAAMKALTIEAPKGWDLDEADPFDPESYERIRKVWSALSEKEATFRPKPIGGAGVGEGTGQDAPVLVPAPVQPGADGLAVSGG